MRTLTVVAPVHNEAENVAVLVQRIVAACESLEGEWDVRVLLVDDGSTDQTLARVDAMRREGYPVGYVKFSRNYGHQAAICAGMAHAAGDAVITMDGDLQHPPELIPRMVRAFEDGADVVQMVRSDPSGGSKGLLSRGFYAFFNHVAETKIVPNASDFRLLSRDVVDVVVRIPEREKFLRGLVPSLGFKQVQMEFDEAERLHGTPSYSFAKSLRLARKALFDYSAAPLKGVFYLGLLMAMISFVVGAGHVIVKLMYWHDVTPGFTDTITAVFFLSGCILAAIGILGRYQMMILEQLRGRPAWVVQKLVAPEAMTKSDSESSNLKSNA
jgi:polyisoprenyl-phosphate glycosyltransferase